MVSSVSSSSLASAWATRIFSKGDTSNQGYIDKASLQAAFDQIGTSSSSSTSSTSATSDVDQLFSTLDSDSDGKVTKDELTSSLQKVADELNSQFDQMRMGMGGGQGGPGGAGGPPPGPPPGGGQGGQDSGFTKDELTQQLSEIGSSDSERSTFISNVVNNFEAADADGDGKVTFKEAQAYNQSLDSSSTSSASTDSTSSTTTAAANDNAVQQQILKLLQAYGVGLADSSTSSSTLSVAA